MANSAWQATIQDEPGNIVEGAEVQVLFESSGTPATIYSDRAGTPLVNPFLTGSTGFAQFYAPAGNYRVVATKDTFTNTWRDQRLGESQGYDVQTSASDFTTGRVALAEGLSYVDPRQFGLGAITLPDQEGLDLDTIDTLGWTYVTTPVNGPTSIPITVKVFTIPHTAGGGRGSQWAYPVNTDEIWYRTQKSSSAWSAWQPVYTGANYQPETINGLGVVRFMQNASGANFNSGSTISGSLLRQYYIGSAIAITPFAVGDSGTWKNVGTTVTNNQGTWCVRIA